MKWKIIKENKRKFADQSYYLKAERNCSEGTLVLEVCWAQIMYSLSVDLFRDDENSKCLYCCLVFYNDRIEKYGHQILRITDDSPISKLKRLESLQKDGALNYVLSKRYNVTFETTLPVKENN